MADKNINNKSQSDKLLLSKEDKKADELKFIPNKTKYGEYKFIGKEKNGSYLFINPIKFDCNWYWGGIYLSGTDVETENALRERQRDIEPEDVGFETKNMGRYFDYDTFHDDMEEDWYEHADILFEQDFDGETYYHCFSIHTHFDSVILNKYKGSYTLFKEDFETYLTRKQFNSMVSLAKQFYKLRGIAEKQHNANKEKYIKEMTQVEVLLLQWEQLTSDFLNLPSTLEN